MANKLIALITGALFTLNQLVMPSQAWAASGTTAVTEVNVPQSFQLELPPELGTIETLISGQGPTIIHIQEAHGSYEIQKKIQAILHHLSDQYDIKLTLLEGSAFKLQPELLRFYPDRPELNLRIAEELAKKGVVTGPELFLLEKPDAEAYGIENLRAYIDNGAAFKEVLTQQEKTKDFLKDMDMQIERLTSPYLNKELRHFLNRLDDYEAKRVPFKEWLDYLKDQSKKHLEIDLNNPYFQIDWPTLCLIIVPENPWLINSSLS